jgi:Family of unknown function (DUF6263)
MSNKLFLVLVAFFTFNFCFAQSNSISIKGKKINKVVIVQNKSTTEIMGQSMEQNMAITTASELLVTDFSDTEIKVEEKSTKLKMKMEMMGQEMEYDSEKPDDNDALKGIGDLINKVTTLTSNAQGIITDIKYDASIEEKIKEMPAMGNGYNKGQPLDFMLVLPKDMAIGKTWTLSFILDENKTDYNYTIKSIDNGVAKVELTANIASTKKAETQGMEVVTKLSGTLVSTITVDVKTNLVKNTNSTINQKGTIELMGQSGPTEMTITTETTFE